jgi:hypothetical protein
LRSVNLAVPITFAIAVVLLKSAAEHVKQLERHIRPLLDRLNEQVCKVRDWKQLAAAMKAQHQDRSKY